MSFQYPLMLLVAAVVVAVSMLGYRRLSRMRPVGSWRRHVAPLLFLAGLAVLLVGVGRPQATVRVPHIAGTIVLAFDVSNSMLATDVSPSRLGAAQEAATEFVRAQPDTVDIGVVSFEQGAITAEQPTADHEQVVEAIERLRAAGGTSLGQAILASLSTIIGEPVSLPDESATQAPDLGYWPSATIVVLSDGEDTGGPDAIAAAELAASAGVRIQTVGVGTVEGATIEVDGYQVSTALDEQLLTELAEATAGTYHRASDVGAIQQVYQDLELRLTTQPQLMELTGAAILLAVGLLTASGLLLTLWYGRIV